MLRRRPTASTQTQRGGDRTRQREGHEGSTQQLHNVVSIEGCFMLSDPGPVRTRAVESRSVYGSGLRRTVHEHRGGRVETAPELDPEVAIR